MCFFASNDYLVAYPVENLLYGNIYIYVRMYVCVCGGGGVYIDVYIYVERGRAHKYLPFHTLHLYALRV